MSFSVYFLSSAVCVEDKPILSSSCGLISHGIRATGRQPPLSCFVTSFFEICCFCFEICWVDFSKKAWLHLLVSGFLFVRGSISFWRFGSLCRGVICCSFFCVGVGFLCSYCCSVRGSFAGSISLWGIRWSCALSCKIGPSLAQKIRLTFYSRLKLFKDWIFYFQWRLKFKPFFYVLGNNFCKTLSAFFNKIFLKGVTKADLVPCCLFAVLVRVLILLLWLISWLCPF